jgi:hypothetical protein
VGATFRSKLVEEQGGDSKSDDSSMEYECLKTVLSLEMRLLLNCYRRSKVFFSLSGSAPITKTCRPDAAGTFLRQTQRTKTDLEAWKKAVVHPPQLAVCKVSQSALLIKQKINQRLFLPNKVHIFLCQSDDLSYNKVRAGLRRLQPDCQRRGGASREARRSVR